MTDREMWEPLTVEGLIATALRVAAWGLDDSKRDDLRKYVLAVRKALKASKPDFGLPAWHGYFDGDPAGFQFVIPSYAFSGTTEERYDVATHCWVVTYRFGAATWEGVSPNRVSAYLDLIAARCGVEGRPQPRRGDDVEAFIERHRDGPNPGGDYRQALDDLLSAYRLYADTGNDLRTDIEAIRRRAGGQ